jgi:protein tyrosine phosphatase (PTP) superfamily phosphohydrolase (DUF442 family)
MKKLYYYFVFALLTGFGFLAIHLSANEPAAKPDTRDLTLLNEKENLFRAGDFYLGGQPSEETLRLLKEQGVKMIINLRSEKEMEVFKEKGYNEDSLAADLGMEYKLLPISGSDAYNPENLEAFAEMVNDYPGKVFIHCYGCYRATYLLLAWMIEYRGYTVEETVEFGRKIKYFSPLEGFLGKKLL